MATVTDTLPLFPLSTVLLPGAALPLHIFESRYRQLVLDLVNDVVPDRRFGVVGIRQGWEVGDDNVDSMYDVGCSARLQQVQQLPQGRYDVSADGAQRFRLLQIDREAAPYLMARVEWLPDTEPADDPRIGICYDVGHSNIISEVGQDQWLETLAPYLKHLHIHNNDGERDYHRALTEGTLDIERLLDGMIEKCPATTTVTAEILADGGSFDWLKEKGYI